MKKLIATFGLVAAMSASLTGVGVATAQPAQALDTTYYKCYIGTPTPLEWKNKNPASCNGIFRITRNAKTLFALDGRKVKNYDDMVKNLKGEYKAAQKWCADNSLTCTVVTSVGLALVQPLWSIARG